MKLIKLGKKNNFAIIDDADLDLVQGIEWYCCRSQKNRSAYCQGKIGRKFVLLGRHLFGLQTGDKRVVRYKNHDALDNRRQNMVVTTRKRVLSNRRPFLQSRMHRQRTSVFKNVSYQGGSLPWKVGRKQSYHRTEKVAALASDLIYIKKFQGDSFLNFPKIGAGRRWYAIDREKKMHEAWVFMGRHQKPNVFRHTNGKHYEARISGRYLGIFGQYAFGLEAYYNERTRMYRELVEKARQ